MNPIFEAGIEGVMCAESVRWVACLENVAPRHTDGLWITFLQDIARLFGWNLEQTDVSMWDVAIGDLTPPQLQAGFRWVVRSCKSMPTPAAVREHALVGTWYPLGEGDITSSWKGDDPRWTLTAEKFKQ